MKFNTGQVESFIKTLQSMKANPGVFADDVGIKNNIPHQHTTYNSVINVIRGIKYSFEALGVKYPQKIEDEVAISRGYDIKAGSPIFAMLDNDMPEAQIIDELIDISIETLRRWYNIEAQN